MEDDLHLQSSLPFPHRPHTNDVSRHHFCHSTMGVCTGGGIFLFMSRRSWKLSRKIC